MPVLQAIREKNGPVALIHIDAHADINDNMFGEKIAHGTPFRRAVDDDLLLCDKVFQIGLLDIIRGCAGLKVFAGDLTEISPLYDTSGNTALVGANLLYEMLCILPGVARDSSAVSI